jgi:hypothetical protein
MIRLWFVGCLFLTAAQAQRDHALPPEFFDTHPTALDGAHFSRVMANEHVEVIRVRLNPHEKTMIMEFPAHVMTCVTDQNVRLIYPHGKPVERTQKAGFAGWMERDQYGVENIGDKPVEWLMIVPNSSRETG